MIFGGIEMADQFSAIPSVQRIGGWIGNDHGSAIGLFGVDPAEVKRDLRGG